MKLDLEFLFGALFFAGVAIAGFAAIGEFSIALGRIIGEAIR